MTARRLDANPDPMNHRFGHTNAMDTIRRSLLRLSAVPVLAALTLLVAVPASAQEAAAQATPGGLRAYWHVFIAYTIAILAVAAWAGSIAKRLADVEKRLGE